MKPKFFPDQEDFGDWLSQNHSEEAELLVGIYKVGSGKLSMTWPESVDQALRFGWIDGVQKRIDDGSYSVRFTPRKSNSIWSAVNIRKIEILTKAGLMHPSGIAAFEKRTEGKSKIYAYENSPAELSTDFEKQFRENEKAWEFFKSQAPSYQRTTLHWIMRAKQEPTRLSRLTKTIEASEKQKRVQ